MAEAQGAAEPSLDPTATSLRARAQYPGTYPGYPIMEQPLSINNTRLPVELLGDIFHRLVEDDDNEVADSKLDNILLICGQSSIFASIADWDKTNIIGLDIQKRGSSGRDLHSSSAYTLLSIIPIADIHLTGPQGVTAARWRSFEYHAPSDGEAASHYDSSTSRLLTFGTSIPPCLPFIKTVKILDLLVGNRGRRPVFLYLCDASSVTEFKLTCWPDFIVAPHCVLQSLVEFKFTGRLAIQSLERFAAPNLRRLTLLVDSGSSYPAFAQCTGVNFERLEYFHFGWPHRIEDASIREYLDAAQILLKKLSQLQTLSFERNSIAELALKLLVDEDADLFPAPPREGHLSLMLDGASCPIGYGSSRRQSIDEFRQMADLDVEKSWGFCTENAKVR
ncbi:SubName: Full=Uncharacterized protein {ECO:0000313/EMBL:CCA73197.1} [Serendipita indica DSM 11827]|nr:SubName: Full=Uncharacterized protein {ECO:0000313/EMBL:CCA73197.1} [Serendipita indica DSM 11827]